MIAVTDTNTTTKVEDIDCRHRHKTPQQRSKPWIAVTDTETTSQIIAPSSAFVSPVSRIADTYEGMASKSSAPVGDGRKPGRERGRKGVNGNGWGRGDRGGRDPKGTLPPFFPNIPGGD